MGILQIILVAASIAFVVADDSCPPAEDISPCTCDGEGFNCMGAVAEDQVRKAFKAKFKYGGVRAVWIQGTTLKSIPSDLFGSIRSQQFYIEVNNITNVNLTAFSASKDTVTTLSLFGNQLQSINYQGLNAFTKLGTFNMGRNLITFIPDNAFKSQSLNTIILAQNKISHIGQNAFANMPNLVKIELSYNPLTVLGPYSLSISSHAAALQIILAGNKLTAVSSTAFQGTSPLAVVLAGNKLTSLPFDSFGKLVESVINKRGQIDISGNPLTCYGCDFSWIVLNKAALRQTLIGFTCVDGRSIDDLTRSNIQC